MPKALRRRLTEHDTFFNPEECFLAIFTTELVHKFPVVCNATPNPGSRGCDLSLLQSPKRHV